MKVLAISRAMKGVRAMPDGHGRTPQTQVWRIDEDGIMRLKETDLPWTIRTLEEPHVILRLDAKS